jgi:general secretion pathway protein K
MTAASSQGVEDNSYTLLPKPFRRKNAPYDSLEELHQIRGVSEDFWQTFIDPDGENPKKRIITVWGQGAVNVNTANAQTLLGLVCGGAPTADICINPEQGSKFIMGVTMARGITMGAPLFGSPRDFVNAMTGTGQLGPLLAGLGMKPVVFQSRAEFEKSITTESKMFSIYAVGIKKGYRRETRVKIHAVVDFRNAPQPGQVPGLPGTTPTAGLPGATPPPVPSATGANPTLPPGAGTDAMLAAMQPSAGGQFVYYRVE